MAGVGVPASLLVAGTHISSLEGPGSVHVQ
nr:MAG TPA: hypothetical protein [Caudoviricetes sp.]